MKPLNEFLNDRHQLKEALFLTRYPDPVLVHRLKRAGGLDLSGETQIAPCLRQGPTTGAMLSMSVANTRALVHLTKVLSRLGGQVEGGATEGSAVVFPLKSRIGAAELSLGRGAEADVPLPFPKISKIHARLRPGGGAYSLCDAGSRNGTQINGATLKQGEWRTLPNEALVQLSEYQFLFYEPAGFYRLLGAE